MSLPRYDKIYNMNYLTDRAEHLSLLWHTLDALHHPAFKTDRKGRILEYNNSVPDRLFYHNEELFDVCITRILKFPPKTLSFDSLDDVHVVEGRCIRKDGEKFHAKVTVVPHDEWLLFIVEDISNVLKIAERATLRRREISTYNALSELLSQGEDLKDILDGVVGLLVKIMVIDGAWIYLNDQDSESLSLCCKEDSSDGYLSRSRMEPYEGFLKRVVSSGRALLVRNADEDPRIGKEINGGLFFKSIAGVPLSVRPIEGTGQSTIGVLCVGSSHKNRFSSLDVQFLNTIANHLGVAIENIRLIEDLKKRMNQISLINEIASIINSSLSIGHIFRIIVSEIRRVIAFDRASINILDEGNRRLRIFAVDTRLPTELVKGRYAPVEGTSSGWVALNQKPWINRDLQKEIPFQYDRVLLREGIRSTVSIPLFKDRPLGTLNFDSLTPNRYSEKDYEILLPIGKHLSVAVENALLFDEISREKRQWEKTFDAVTDMVWIEDLGGRVLRVNRTVIERAGKPELAIIKKPSSELMNMLKIRSPSFRSLEMLRGKSRLYHELRGHDGGVYHFWSYPLVDSDGRTYGVVNYLRDVTEQKRLEQQLLRADRLASLGTLVAGIAHEINNPLGIIAGYSEALLERAGAPELCTNPDFEDFPEYLETINREIFRCKDILKSLLEFARPSSSTMRIIDINELIKEVVLLVNYRAKRSNHQLILELGDDLPDVYADPGAMRQVFMNIIMNSFYFMDRNGKISIRTEALEGDADNPMIEVSIADNGKGISKDVIERIFDPFFTTKPVGEGTGLGLSICHRIVTEHNGFLEVESEIGKGTTFIIRLPARRN